MGLEYQILSAVDVREGITDKALADEVVAYVREKFDDLQCDCALKHLATAIGPNLAVLEIEWNGVEIADIFPVHANRLNMLLGQSDKVLVRTADNLIGMPAESPKFVVHVPESVSGSPLAGGLLEAQAFVWLIKKLSLQDWATFCELFGMPIRWAKHQPGATPEEKKLLEEHGKRLGLDLKTEWVTFTSGAPMNEAIIVTTVMIVMTVMIESVRHESTRGLPNSVFELK
jgi:phage gp29-like protein